VDSGSPQKMPATRNQTIPLRRRLLYGLAIIAIAAAWYVVLTDPAYRFTILRAAGATPTTPPYPALNAGALEQKDPPLGSELPRIGVGKDIRIASKPSRGGYLLAFIGDCASCSKLDLEKLQSQTRARGITLIVLSNGEDSRVTAMGESLRRIGVDVPIYRDPDNRLASVLNTYYAGRLYYFTPAWRLRWRERDFGVDNYLFRTGRFDRLMRNTNDGNG
jgi:hypothetical protein